jgi:hypothetical protein
MQRQPETTQVMSGFDVAILGDGGAMGPVKEGGVRTVLLPPRLAYGEKGDQCVSLCLEPLPSAGVGCQGFVCAPSSEQAWVRGSGRSRSWLVRDPHL